MVIIAEVPYRKLHVREQSLQADLGKPNRVVTLVEEPIAACMQTLRKK